MSNWRLAVLNAKTAVDPQEVIYRLVQVDEHGYIVRADAKITNTDHGWMQRLQEASAFPLLTVDPDPIPQSYPMGRHTKEFE